MKERPILFSAPMVRAILDGIKTQTRRPVKNYGMAPGIGNILKGSDDIKEWPDFCPYGKTGDRLWVRETWINDYDRDGYLYKADCHEDGTIPRLSSGAGGLGGGVGYAVIKKWKPSIHMPRRASRISLEITGVRVERLQDISEEDAIAEGVEELDGHFNEADYCAIAKKISCCIGDSKPVYAQLWESLNGKGSWDLNPFVWVIEFKRI